MWFKTRILGKVHVFVPSVEGVKKVYSNEFGLFGKKLIKSVEDMMGKTSLLVVPESGHMKIRKLLGEPFSMNNVSKFVPKLDRMLSDRLKKLQLQGKSFRLLDFTMKVYISLFI